MLKNWLIASRTEQLLWWKSQGKGITAAEIFTSICFAPLTRDSVCACVCGVGNFSRLALKPFFAGSPPFPPFRFSLLFPKPPETLTWAICHRNSSARLPCCYAAIPLLVQRFENALIYQYVSCCITINVARAPKPSAMFRRHVYEYALRKLTI